MMIIKPTWNSIYSSRMVSLAWMDLFLVRGRDVPVFTISVISFNFHYITLSLVMRHVGSCSRGAYSCNKQIEFWLGKTSKIKNDDNFQNMVKSFLESLIFIKICANLPVARDFLANNQASTLRLLLLRSWCTCFALHSTTLH